MAGDELELRFDPEGRVVEVRLAPVSADPLPDDPVPDDSFVGEFALYDPDEEVLQLKDPYRPPVASDVRVFEGGMPVSVPNEWGLVRARRIAVPPGMVPPGTAPRDLVVEIELDVFAELENSAPTQPGPNASALLSLDLDPQVDNQNVVHRQNVDQTILWAIYADNLIDVTGLSVDLTYDSDQVEFLGESPRVADEASVLPSEAVFPAPKMPAPGTIRYTGLLLPGARSAAGQPVSGPLVAMFEFSALQLSRAHIGLERVVLRSPGGTDILRPNLVAQVVPEATGIADFDDDGFVGWIDLFMLSDATLLVMSGATLLQEIFNPDATRQVWSVGIEGGDTFLKYG